MDTTWNIANASPKPPGGMHAGLSRSGKQNTAKGTSYGPALEFPASASNRPRVQGALELNLLGTPQIMIGGHTAGGIDRCSRGPLLLCILSLHRRGLSSAKLAEYLARSSSGLDDEFSPGDAGMRAVRMLVCRLRRLSGHPDIVVSVGSQRGYQNLYRLPDNTICDVWEFERNLSEAERLSVQSARDPAAAEQAALLRQNAIALYKGEFCRGIGLDYISEAAAQFHRRYLQTLLLQANYWKARAAQSHAQQGNRALREQSQSERAIDAERCWLESLNNYMLAIEAEPYEEAAYAGAMLCQSYLGQAANFKHTFARCADVLRTHLDREPKQSTLDTAKLCDGIISSAHPLHEAQRTLPSQKAADLL